MSGKKWKLVTSMVIIALVTMALGGCGTDADLERFVEQAARQGKIAAGGGHSLVILDDGSLWAWGGNSFGRLGDGTTIDRHTPVHIMDDVAAVSAGSFHTLAITTDGSLWAWGGNWDGQLGDGTTTARRTPVHIMDDVVAVSAGSWHTLAITTDGSLWAWGRNWDGQLGDGTTIDRHTPVHIMDDVVAVSAGGSYTLAITTGGSLWAWGSNEFDQLGGGTTIARHTPMNIETPTLPPPPTFNPALVGTWRAVEATGVTQAELMLNPIEFTFFSDGSGVVSTEERGRVERDMFEWHTRNGSLVLTADGRPPLTMTYEYSIIDDLLTKTMRYISDGRETISVAEVIATAGEIPPMYEMVLRRIE